MDSARHVSVPSLWLGSALAVLVAAGRVAAQQAAAGAPRTATPSLAMAIGERLQRFRSERDLPGLSCAVAVGDRIVYAGGHGLSDVENEVPATERTVYRLASISKPITAVLAMQLAEAGQLDLDAPVHTLLDEWPSKRWPVTTRQLLGHLGGVRHYTAADGPGERTRRFRDQTSALSVFAGDALLHEPGTRFRYSTFGFNLAAAVVERCRRQSFGDVVRERIAVPCDAPTLQDDDQRRIIPHRAQGYVRRGGVLQNSQLMDSSYKLGGGGLCANAPDLVRFAQALIDGRLVGAETLRTMWTSQRTRDGAATGYGLGFGVGEQDGVRVVQHSGAQARVSTMLLLVPEQRIAVAVLCNLEGERLGGLAAGLVRLVRGAEGGR